MNNHQSQQQSAASPGHKPDNLNKDNLQPSSKTPNLTGSAGFIPQTPSGDITSSVEKYTASEILQMMKIDYSSINEPVTQAKSNDGNGEKVMGKQEEKLSLDQNGEHPWFDDQGEVLFNHWRNGKGDELFLDDPEFWGNYMRAHSGLRDAIEREIAGKVSKEGVFNGVMSYDFGGGYQTGYQLLGGSNAWVGGLSYSGYLSKNGSELNFNVNLTWNDIMDPIDSWDDSLGAWLFPGTSYNVHISWSYDFTLYNFDEK